MKQMKKNILCTVLSGLAVLGFVGEAVAKGGETMRVKVRSV